ncbi:hypothetical protein [Rheinheimera salexigens]|uniref:RiboL-PSP-HEPN domain-containing protein n=1 Tax=Rheinheimera salexigens TaxID=1628148 RepID=A0A1E7Q793_9GAMM|nr:hypothetical protein [Rheinheimera salexigens]OEY70016.1 hypothetical protein BI198_10895 [Rheinheimera salexigens]
MAHITLEMALRSKFLIENPRSKTPTFGELLKLDAKNKWIEDERFPSLLAKEKQHAWDMKNFKAAHVHDFQEQPEMTCIEPNETDIKEALAKLDLVTGVTSTANKLRNNLAHGATTLHPHSISILKTVSEVINQLFEGL